MPQRFMHGIPLFAAILTAILMSINTAVAITPKPDLVVRSLSNPKAFLVLGESFNETYTVKNIGNAQAKASVLKIYISKDANKGSSDKLIGMSAVRKIAAHKTRRRTIAVTVPQFAEERSWRVIACADVTKRVRESKEGNQCRVAKVVTSISSPPSKPTGLSSNPSGIAGDPTPTISGTAMHASIVRLYNVTVSPDCTGVVVGTQALVGVGMFAIDVTTSQTSGIATQYVARSADAHGHSSPCSDPTTAYTYDQNIPLVPVLTFIPASPANNTMPHVHTGADSTAGTTVALYNNADCSGAPIVGGEALVPDGTGDIDAGITVLDDTINQFSATATRAGTTSDCSSSAMYVEDSTAPDPPTIISSAPVSPGNTLTPTVSGTGAEAEGSVKLYRDDGITDCGTLVGQAVTALDGTWSVNVGASMFTVGYAGELHAKSVDAAGNESACSVSSLNYVRPFDVAIGNFTFGGVSNLSMASQTVGYTVRFTVVAGLHSVQFTSPVNYANSPGAPLGAMSSPHVVTFGAANTYNWQCGIHGAMMSGTISITA